MQSSLACKAKDKDGKREFPWAPQLGGNEAAQRKVWISFRWVGRRRFQRGNTCLEALTMTDN